MKIAIVGSRGFKCPELVREAVQQIAARAPETVIVSGGARGVDSWAEAEASRLGLSVEIYPADWSRGRGAGMERNRLIIQAADKVLAFHDGVSRGTAFSIQLAKQVGKPCVVVIR